MAREMESLIQFSLTKVLRSGAVCRALQLTVLIVDSQSSGRGRFIAVGPPACDPAASNYFVVLHRTRREHFNLVTLLGGRAVFRRHELPTAIASVWNMTLSEQQAGALPSSSPSVVQAGTSPPLSEQHAGEPSSTQAVAAVERTALPLKADRAGRVHHHPGLRGLHFVPGCLDSRRPGNAMRQP